MLLQRTIVLIYLQAKYISLITLMNHYYLLETKLGINNSCNLMVVRPTIIVVSNTLPLICYFLDLVL